ncbi:MAG: hypothetical protein LBN27_11270 [Prevotellaceae bacterium]|nr:hypothetical protein [Prevotellaceae bacterium]
MTNKERYRIWCEEKPIPLFMQAWWLDAVCVEGKEWNVLLYEENDKIIAALPYHLLKKCGFKIVIQPQQTQYNGIWIDYPKDRKLHKRYSFEKKVMDNLISQLENLKLSYFSQHFHHSFTNWQPFYWRNFKQTTRYTYVLKDIENAENIFENLHPRYKQRIRKEKEELTVSFDLPPDVFYEFHKKSLQQAGQKVEYSEKLFLSIFNAATCRNQGKIIAVKDKNDNLLSALFVVWDTNCGYNLITARRIVNGSNASSICMIWEAIKYLGDKAKNYDFEGSMIEGVACVNQQFGAEQTPYFSIEKSYSCICRLLLKMKIYYEHHK